MNLDSAVVLIKYGLFIDLRIDFVILWLKKRVLVTCLHSKRPIFALFEKNRALLLSSSTVMKYWLQDTR